jgi:hypothetical protein
MTTLRRPKRRKHSSATMFGTAAIALAIGGLAGPAVAHAEWNIEEYDACLKNASALFCCVASGGEWNIDKYKCEAPAASQTTQNSGGVGTGTAAQTPNDSQEPVGQAPVATPAQTPPRNPWGINTGTRTQT